MGNLPKESPEEKRPCRESEAIFFEGTTQRETLGRGKRGKLEGEGKEKGEPWEGVRLSFVIFFGGLVAVATFAATFAAVAIAAVAATAAAAGLGFEFFGGGVADGNDVAFEAYIFACEGMVEVHFDIGVGDFGHDAIDAEAVGGHHGKDGTGLNNFF